MLQVFKHLCGQSPSFHKTILLKFAELTRSEGLKLLSPSSDYDDQVGKFFRTMQLLCELYSIPPETILPRPRADSGIRSRIDSTGSRILRSLGAGTEIHEQQLNFVVPVTEINESLNILWDTLDHWFILIREDLSRLPGSPIKMDNLSLNESEDTPETVKEEVQVVSDAMDSGTQQEVSTREIAKALYRTKPKSNTNRRSLVSLDSIILSQPALEFNMGKVSTDLSGSGNFSGGLERRLFVRSVSGHAQFDTGHALNDTEPTEVHSLVDEATGGSINPVNTQREIADDSVGRDSDEIQEGRHRNISNSSSAGPSYQTDQQQGSHTPVGSRRSNRGTPRWLDFNYCSNRNKETVKEEERDIVELTADRLCAVVHGFHMFNCSQQLWNER